MGRSKSSKSLLIFSDIRKEGSNRASQIKTKDLRNLYVKNKMSMKEIGQFYGVSGVTIRNKINKANIPVRTKAKRNQYGPNHDLWRINPSYRTIHMRVEYHKGKPSYCEKCGTTNKNIKYEWANINGDYTNVDNFRRLCVPCHREEHPRLRDRYGRFL